MDPSPGRPGTAPGDGESAAEPVPPLSRRSTLSVVAHAAGAFVGASATAGVAASRLVEAESDGLVCGVGRTDVAATAATIASSAASPLRHDEIGIADAFVRAGYRTAWIGKWHLPTGSFPLTAVRS